MASDVEESSPLPTVEDNVVFLVPKLEDFLDFAGEFFVLLCGSGVSSFLSLSKSLKTKKKDSRIKQSYRENDN